MKGRLSRPLNISGPLPSPEVPGCPLLDLAGPPECLPHTAGAQAPRPYSCLLSDRCMALPPWDSRWPRCSMVGAAGGGLALHPQPQHALLFPAPCTKCPLPQVVTSAPALTGGTWGSPRAGCGAAWGGSWAEAWCSRWPAARSLGRGHPGGLRQVQQPGSRGTLMTAAGPAPGWGEAPGPRPGQGQGLQKGQGFSSPAGTEGEDPVGSLAPAALQRGDSSSWLWSSPQVSRGGRRHVSDGSCPTSLCWPEPGRGAGPGTAAGDAGSLPPSPVLNVSRVLWEPSSGLILPR